MKYAIALALLLTLCGVAMARTCIQSCNDAGVCTVSCW